MQRELITLSWYLRGLPTLKQLKLLVWMDLNHPHGRYFGGVLDGSTQSAIEELLK